jgi:hypothetical protein
MPFEGYSQERIGKFVTPKHNGEVIDLKKQGIFLNNGLENQVISRLIHKEMIIVHVSACECHIRYI